LPNPKARLKDQFHEVARFKTHIVAHGRSLLELGGAFFEISQARRRLAASA